MYEKVNVAQAALQVRYVTDEVVGVDMDQTKKRVTGVKTKVLVKL